MEIQSPYFIDGAAHKVAARSNTDTSWKVAEMSENYIANRDERITEGFLAAVKACQLDAERNGIKELSEEEFDKLIHGD